MVPSVGKVTATIFWNSQDVIFTDYLGKGRTITGQYYADLLGQFGAELMKKQRIWRRKKGSFTRRTHQLTHPQLPQQNWLNYATNYCLIHPILQIWPIQFVFVPKHEKMAWRKEIHLERGSHRRNRGLLCGVRQTIFFGWLEIVRTKCIELY